MQPPPQPPHHNPDVGKQRETNPFRSQRLRPGVVPYLFADGQTIDDLLKRLSDSRWRGEIFGPHGTGKSTLIQELLPQLAARGCSVLFGSFSGGKQQWTELAGADVDSTLPKCVPRIVVIDGFEQLSALARCKWKWSTYLWGQGLIVTSHHSMGLPVLQKTTVSAPLAREIAQRIAGDDLGGLTADDVTAALQTYGGNMRDALFALYDRIEAERR